MIFLNLIQKQKYLSKSILLIDNNFKKINFPEKYFKFFDILLKQLSTCPKNLIHIYLSI